MKHRVEYNIFNLVRDLEKQKQETFSYAEIARGVGVHRHTIESMIAGEADESFRRKLAAILDFFNGQGMSVSVADLFVVTPDDRL